jgi:kynurenine formamidase
MTRHPHAEADGFPAYRNLGHIGDLPARVAWGVFGSSARLGTLNFLTEDRVAAAARLVRRGAVFPVNWRIELPDPPMFGRQPLRHTVKVFPTGTDDFYDSFYPQGSSQWDALCHIGHPTYGYFGGLDASAVADPTTNPLGIESWSRRGIAGRFVLLDIARSREAQGRTLDPTASIAIHVEELQAIADAEGVELHPGDILLLRFGWIHWYEGADPAARAQTAALGHAPTPGLAQSEATAAWLWDHRIAAVVADNPGVECYPADPNNLEEFLHYRLITFLGMAVGELFDLEALSADCAEDGVYEGLFTSAPLNKQGGSGSPANALALK